jgi:hypothetical protein
MSKRRRRERKRRRLINSLELSLGGRGLTPLALWPSLLIPNEAPVATHPILDAIQIQIDHRSFGLLRSAGGRNGIRCGPAPDVADRRGPSHASPASAIEASSALAVAKLGFQV